MVLSRFVEVTIGKSPNSRDALVVSSLDLSFKVERTILFEPSTAELQIYNAKEETRKIIGTEGNSVIIKAGYEGKSQGIIFSGVVSKAVSTHPGADWLTTISATNSRAVGEALAALTVEMSYARGTSIDVIIRELADKLGMLAIGLENVKDVQITGNFTHSGNVRGALRYIRQILAANQKGFFTDNNEFVCFNMGKASEFTATYLDYESGLLSVKQVLTAQEQADAINATRKKHKVEAAKLRKRVEFTSLLLPQIRPNSLVTLKSNEVDGTYLVEKITYTGDNMGKDWTIEAEATAS